MKLTTRYFIQCSLCLVVLVAMTLVLQPGVSVAQTPPTTNPTTQSEPEYLRAGSLSVGFGGMFHYNHSRSGQSDGDADSETSSFFRAGPTVGYFLLDRLEFSLSFELLLRNFDSTRRLSLTQREWVIELDAAYFFPVTQRMALITSLGVGMYFGVNQRPLEIDDNDEIRETREETDTFGLSTSLFLGAGYMATQRAQLRAGIGFNGLFGREAVGSIDENLSMTTLHASLAMSLLYTF